MRAVIYERYGGPEVLKLADVDAPTPDEGEVLVAVRAATVNRTDAAFRQASPFVNRFVSGLRRPKRRILGSEFAGEVVAVGRGVTAFAVGDQVFGVNAHRFGTHAELVPVAETSPIARKPDGVTFPEAAATPDGFVLARAQLRWAGVTEGRRVLVYGASGSIGTAVVQLAAHEGASVTAVCGTRDVELVGSLGADRVIDYTQADFTRDDATYDVVIDAVGKTSFRRCRGLLARGGTYASTDLGTLAHTPLLAAVTWVTRRFGGRRVLMPIPDYAREHVERLAEMLAAGEYRAVVDRCYPLEEVVEATEYVETEQKTGNVVLTIDPAATTDPTEPAKRSRT